jgi:hypothetical protein
MFVRFKIRGVDATDEPTAEQEKTVAEFKAKAEAGDPHSQLAYSFLLTMRPDMRSADLNMDLTLRAAQAGIPAAQYLVGMRALPRDIGQPAGKGVIWLQMAADAGQHDAQAALASYLLRTASPDDFGKAQDLLEKAAASDHAEGKFYLAALLAAGPDSARRDPGRALVLLEQVKDSFDFDPTWFEIRAAAKAMLGEFAAAQKDQKAALQKAQKLGWDTKDLQARLSGYAASKPWTGNFFLY